MMKCGVVVFPGSNCDHDCYHILKNVLGWDTRWVWHKDESTDGLDLLVLPGGFSYGDYLRPGSIARFSPVMRAVSEFAKRGGRVLGICNGFQILLESGLLPGALMRNRSQRFICRFLPVRVEASNNAFTHGVPEGTVWNLPIAHADGNYFAETDTLNRLEGEGRVAFRYCTTEGEVTEASNPNGSLNNIAGIVNETGNVLGLMPHPERAADPTQSQSDGRRFFEAMLNTVNAS